MESHHEDTASPASKTSTSQEAPPAPAPAPATIEADEFGLPIRRYFAPASPATAQDPSVGQGNATDHADAATETDMKTPEARDDARASQPKPQPGENHEVGSDSDETTFEDAPTAIPSVPGASSPPRPESEPPTPTAKPTISVTDGEAVTRVTQTDPSEAATGLETPKIKQEPADEPIQHESIVEASQTEQGQQLPSPSKPSDKKPTVAHSRDASIASNGVGVSEFSHQQLSVHHEAETEGGDGGWQTMPAFARYDMYDDDNRLIAREHNGEEEIESYGYGGLGGAGKGYTRVLMDEDAQSATSMDENTQYLFKETNTANMAGEDDDARDAMSQMQATKDLLTEGQRIAYVGVVRLEIATLVKEAEDVEVTKRIKKELSVAAEAIKMWGQKMMIRLYSHMDISEAEQVMIEQLADHGVIPADLTPALHANSRVQNPLAEGKEPKEKGPEGEEPIDKDSDEKEAKEEESIDKDSDEKEANEKESIDKDSKEGQSLSSRIVEEDEEEVAEPPPPYESVESSKVPEAQTPSQLPTTEKIDIDLRWTVLCDLFLILIADSVYDARSRVLLERVGASLDISWIDICKFEKRVTDALEMQQAAEKENWNEDEHMESRRKLALKRRYVLMGLATVGGGLVIGLSAGLLAPVIGAGLAAGFTTIGVTGTSGFLAGAGGAAIITSSAAASGSLIGVRAANRRTGAVKTFEYRPLHNNKRVNLIVTVSGWLTGKVDDVRLPFSTVDPIMGDIYSVLWEPEMLRSMGDTINILATEALTQGLQQILGSTILVSLMAAIQLPVVLTKLSYLIDNPWAVSLDRATSAGHILADSLMERSLGTRPITLVGYSLGARVIFSCLQELAKKGAHGLVQNVYVFGSPVVVKKEEFLRARSIVSGRFVNGYNRNDWILGYLFRLTNGGIRRIAGLAPIDECAWIENMDVTDMVAGHMEYRKAMPSLLMKCGWSVESEEFTEIEDPDPDNHKERQRELINEIEEARKELEREGKAKKGGKFSIFSRRKKAQREEWEVYEDSAGKEASREAGKVEDQEGNNHGVLFDIDAIRAELAKEAQNGASEEELQVREIQSTLPPMKLDFSPISAPASSLTVDGRNPLRETKSADVLPLAGSSETRTWADHPPAYVPEPPEEDIQMTFDTSFHDEPLRDDELTRPTVKTSKTLPNVTLTDPWADLEDEDEDFGKEKEISMTFA